MDWTQALTVIGVFIGGFIYMMNKMDANKKDTDTKMESHQKENNTRFTAIDNRFNGIENRLTAMEVEVKNINQRIDDFKHETNQRLSTIEGYLVPKKVFHFEESKDEEPKEN